MVKNNGPLQIRLTEPVIFLKGPSTGLDFRGRPQAVRQDGPSAMVRGLLTLRLSKPTRIRSITIKLEGKARTEWPEGIGSKRMDTHEEHVILADQTTFFNAMSQETSRSRSTRRALSLGPGFRPGYEDDDLDGDIDTIPRDGVDGDDWVNVERPHRAMIRSSSAMPGTHDGHSWHRDGFSRRPSFDDSPSVRSSLLDLANLNVQDRGPSPAYTPNASPPRRSSQLPGHGSRQSSLRQSNPPLPVSSREPALSPIASAAPSQSASERGDSAEAEHRRAAHIRSALSGDAVQEGAVWSPPPSQPQDDNALEDEETDSPALRPIINARSSHMSTGEVRFQDPPLETVEEPISTPSTVPPPNNRAASVRTFNSQFSSSSASLSLSAQEPTATENHPTGVQAISVANTAHNSPANSAPPSIHQRTSTETLNDSSPNTSRRTSVLAPEPAATVTRRGRSSRTGSASTIVETPGLGSQVNLPSSLRNASGQQRAASGTPSLSSAPSLQHLRNASSTHRDSSEDSRGRKSSKFSLAATLRGISRDVKETFHHNRHASKSRSRRESPTRDSISDRPPLPTSSSSTTSMTMARSGSGTTVNDTRRRPAVVPDDFVPYGRGGAGSTSRQSRSRERDASARGRDEERSRSRARGRHIGMKVLTDKLGLGEHEEASDDVHNWKEFRKEFGSVTYRLKASVVRVGALTPNLTEDMEINMIAQPQEDDMEETENVLVERQWEEQMRYQITLGGKAFPIAGTIPISIRLMPLLKCKIHRLTVALEEKKVARHETPKRFVLLFIKQPDAKERIEPLLPIISDDPNAAENSPVAEMARQAVINNPPTDVFDLERDPNDSMYAQLMEPTGPWHLEKDLHIPDCTSKIKFTTKHDQTNITVGHWLKVTIRVERGDDEAMDTKGRRKQFDIIIETPIKILDCRVNSHWNSLPTYSALNRGVSSIPGVCSVHGNKSTAPIAGSGRPENNLISTASSIIIHPHASDVGSSHIPRRATVDLTTGPTETGEDSLLERNIVYDRLMSGQQTETGEIPPSYGDVLAEAARGSGRNSRSVSRVREMTTDSQDQLSFTTRGRPDSTSRSRSRLGMRD
ncbi:uncharacterized protein IL334_006559 [Kwoniella shivajii]|uniref:Arrestin C-terminal-like domain-containing protein n=1 Tax=Kwoniella shivajii TaxID=564305 RepID=A0ABZ1D6W1_9TREE|nr:hypothetical protein IL334_006559 [Kwoniella shivajii]